MPFATPISEDRATVLSVDTLTNALPSADLRVLLMVLFHMTGDETWLKPPFRPARDVRLVPDPEAGLSPDIARTIREAALRLLSTVDVPAVGDPGDALMLRMMSATLGEDVSPEYAPLNREEMALKPRLTQWTGNTPPADLAGYPVLIVGAGVSGLGLAVSLEALSIPYRIIEERADLGGTWYVNRYPGAGVDTPNHSYSFSFGPTYSWPRYFSRREDVLAYLNAVADTHQLRRNILFNTRLESARWDAGRKMWQAVVRTAEGEETLEAAFLVTAIGQLSDPSRPLLPGADSFAGDLIHSSEWPEGLPFAGRRIGVIGTGATAMQLVPALSETAAQVTVYQRTAQWSRPIPGYADPISPAARWLLENVPFYDKWFRFNMFWRYGDGLLPFLRKDPDWPHKDRSINRANDRHREEITAFIRDELDGRPDLIDKCIPDYPPYGKRILLDNDWYRTLRKPNVDLVCDRIDSVTRLGIRTSDGQEHPHDLIVHATGFKVTELAARLNITGEGGQTLAEAWADDNPTAYLGLCVPGFPNMFCLLGPNSGPAHGGSAIFQVECQTQYISGCLVQMIEGGHRALSVHQTVHDAYQRRVDAEHEQLIWTHPGMSTYYRNRHNRVFSVMPWRFVDYWAMTREPRLDEFALVR